MKAISEYVLSIIAVIILSTTSSIFLSDKKIGKLINYFFSSLIILMIITPVISFFSKEYKYNANIFNYEIQLDNTYIDYVSEIMNSELNKSVQSMLQKNGYKNVKIRVENSGQNNFIKSVYVNLDNLVIDADYEHINKYERISLLICDYLEIKNEAIIYE